MAGDGRDTAGELGASKPPASKPLSAEEAQAYRVRRFYSSLTSGCGRPTGCCNPNCASARHGAGPMNPNDAALKALQLAQDPNASWCGTVPFLDFQYVTHSLAHMKDAEAREKVVGTLWTQTLSSRSAVYESFPDTVHGWPGIDWEGLGAFWALITETLPASELMPIMEKFVAENCAAAPGRTCTLILSCPILSDPQYHASVLVPCYERLRMLFSSDPEQGALTSDHWCSAPLSVRSHLLRCCKEVIILDVYQNYDSEARTLTKGMWVGLDVCKVLYHANEKAKEPRIPYQDFYNDAINEEVATDDFLKEDFGRYMNSPSIHRTPEEVSLGKLYPFVLDTASKATYLKVDAIHQMARQFESAILRSIVTRSVQVPYLVVNVRRKEIVNDALHALSRQEPEDLKKPLKVHFVGEDGVDEGGVQKEFFSLITGTLFDPDYGMFVQDEKTGLVWFNVSSLESSREFELVGCLVGVAIYNGVLIQVRFPHVLYKKLMEQPEEGEPCGFEDLKLAFPVRGDKPCPGWLVATDGLGTHSHPHRDAGSCGWSAETPRLFR